MYLKEKLLEQFFGGQFDLGKHGGVVWEHMREGRERHAHVEVHEGRRVGSEAFHLVFEVHVVMLEGETVWRFFSNLVVVVRVMVFFIELVELVL